MEKLIIFDVEITETGQFIGFKVQDEIVQIDLNDTKTLITFIEEHADYTYVGFNNFEYDNAVLNYCLSLNNLKTALSYEMLVNLNDSIIKNPNSKKVYNIIYKNQKIPTLDVYSMLKQKKSLKLASFVSYKYLFSDNLATNSIDDLKKYNIEDLELTNILFMDKCEKDYDLTLYLADYLKIKSTSNNFTIYQFLQKVAKYNTNFKLESCLNQLTFIDNDLKQLALELIQNDKLTEKYTIDKHLVKKGGLHYPVDSDFTKKGVKYIKEAYNYDFSSYYPNIYINLLDFFDPETKILLKTILNDRLQAKKNNDNTKNNALKLFINTIYGQLASINKYYMYSVALLGQIIIIQLIRDNNINKNDIVEINTDGILLKSRYENLINNAKIELEESIINEIYHKNSNTKSYMQDNKLVAKGKLLMNNDYTEKLSIVDMTPCLLDIKDDLLIEAKIYNSFIVKHKYKDKLPVIKYYKFENIEDIKKYALKDNCCLLNKQELIEAIANNTLVEITEYNKEDITSIIKELFQNYIKEAGEYVLINDIENIKLDNEQLNITYQKYKDIFYMMPSNKKKYYKNIPSEIKHPTPNVHNTLMFSQKPNTQTLAIICDKEYIAVDVDNAEQVDQDILDELEKANSIKIITVDKNNKQIDTHKFKYIFKQDPKGVSLRNIDGLEYLKGMRKCNIDGIKEANKYYFVIHSDIIDVLPQCFSDGNKPKTYNNNPQTSTRKLNFTKEKLNAFNQKLKHMFFTHEPNPQYIKLTSKCYNNHENGNNKSVMIVLNETYCSLTCLASSCNLNDKGDKLKKQLLKMIFDTFYSKNVNESSKYKYIEAKDIKKIKIPMMDGNVLEEKATHNYEYPTIQELKNPIEEEYIYKIDDHLLPKGVTAMLTSRGGLGKSYFILNLMCQLILNKKDMILNNMQIADDIKVVYYSLEDTKKVVLSRLQRIIQAYKLDNHDIQKIINNLAFVYDLKRQRLTMDNYYLEDAITKNILKFKCDVMVIDTLARICDVDSETDNIKATQFIEIIERIAEKTNCTIILLHHTSKQSVSDDSILANARGSSALVDTCRYVLTLKDYIQQKAGYKNEKEQDNIDEIYKKYNISNIVDVFTAKSNYSGGFKKRLAIDTNFKMKEMDKTDRDKITSELHQAKKTNDSFFKGNTEKNNDTMFRPKD